MPDNINLNTPKTQELKGFTKAFRAFEAFAKSQQMGGIILIFCTIAALYLANSVLSSHYFHINFAKLGFHWDSFKFSLSWQHWVNDGLMAIFFLLVGLEIKREILSGELSDISKAILPIVAAIGGMVFPAILFYLTNMHHTAHLPGWGIPMATDIAFALGILSLMGKRVPRNVMIFLSAVAIVDDLGAVLVIALFYTHKIHWLYLAGAGLTTIILIILNRLRVHKLTPYLILGVILWLCLLGSGIHATIAGVILAFCIPGRSYYQFRAVSKRLHVLVTQFDQASINPQGHIDKNDRKNILHTIEHLALEVETPLQRLEHMLHSPVTFFIIPVFVLFNAGIDFTHIDFIAALTNPITLGIILGLVLGKILGIFGSCYACIKLKFSELPKNISLKHLFSVSILAGIGFTMSIFISELAYSQNSHFLTLAKTGILIASILAAVLGIVTMWVSTTNRAQD